MNPLPKKALSKLTNYLRKLKSTLSWQWLIGLIIFVGIFLRFAQYLLNRSLWIDEAFVVLNLNRSFSDLLKPLEYNQGTPIGFLFVEKFIINVFGDSEYSLRLFPFICGIASIFLFYKLARWFTKLPTVCIALGLFVLSDRLIYYSAEVKQYSSDVAVTLLVYLAVINLQSAKINPFKIITCGTIGALAIWFSHPSVFVLAGTGITLIITLLWQQNKKWSRFIDYSIIFLMWTISFLLFYWISIRALINNEQLQSSWSENHNSFMPLIPSNITELRWFIDKFFEIFNYPLGIHLTGIAALAFIVGLTSLWFRNKEKLFIVISPVLISLLASGLHKYPFKGQLLLFIIPSMLLVVAEGTQQIIDKTRSNSRIIATTFAVLLFLYPLYYAAGNLRNPQYPPHFEYQRVREEIKPVLSYVEQNQQKGDVLYIYYASQYAFKYYSERYGFNDKMTGQAVLPDPPEDWFAPALPSYPPQLIIGEYSRNDWSIFENELSQLRGKKRVWVVFSHVKDRRSSLDEEDIFLYMLDRVGTQVDSFKSTESAVYLYDLSETSKTDRLDEQM